MPEAMPEVPSERWRNDGMTTSCSRGDEPVAVTNLLKERRDVPFVWS